MYAHKEELKNYFNEIKLKGSFCYDFNTGDSRNVDYITKLKCDLLNSYNNSELNDIDNFKAHASNDVENKNSSKRNNSGSSSSSSSNNYNNEGSNGIEDSNNDSSSGSKHRKELLNLLDNISYLNENSCYNKNNSYNKNNNAPPKGKRELSQNDYLNIKKSRLINNLNYFMRVCCNKSSYIKFINHYFNIIYSNSINVLFKYECILQKFAEQNEKNLTENDYYNGYINLNKIPILMNEYNLLNGMKLDINNNQEYLKNNSNLESNVLNFINVYDNLTVNFFNHIFTKINNNEMNIQNSNVDYIIHNFLQKKKLLKENVFNLLLNISESYEIKYCNVITDLKNDEHVKERNERIIFEMLKNKVEGRFSNFNKGEDFSNYDDIMNNDHGNKNFNAAYNYDIEQDSCSKINNSTEPDNWCKPKKGEMYVKGNNENMNMIKGKESDTTNTFCKIKSSNLSNSNSNSNNMTSNNTDTTTTSVATTATVVTAATVSTALTTATAATDCVGGVSETTISSRVNHHNDEDGIAIAYSTGVDISINSYSNGVEKKGNVFLNDMKEMLNKEIGTYDCCYRQKEEGEEKEEDHDDNDNDSSNDNANDNMNDNTYDNDDEHANKNANAIDNIYKFLKNNTFIPNNNIYTDFVENGNDIFLNKIKKSDKNAYFKLIEKFDRMYNIINEFKSNLKTSPVNEDTINNDNENFQKHRKRKFINDEYELKNANHTKRCLRNCNCKKIQPVKRSKRIINKTEISKGKKMK
ncbi:hypothetical protein, conserved [Plasmodium malariae]|uniref:Uncharacterized protein n=1 Tax=Plasmodium malariae TaxID=5858 RepID=A0A1A8WWB8_PLAMA|nr:hypothetical protein, conserved [Plasmodium malariae]